MTLKDDLPVCIRIFNPIDPIARVIDVGIEANAAFEEIVVAGAAG